MRLAVALVFVLSCCVAFSTPKRVFSQTNRITLLSHRKTATSDNYDKTIVSFRPLDGGTHAAQTALSFWAIVTLFTLAAAQETLQPYAPPIMHTFLDSANVYPESVTVDQSSGTFFVGSVKEGTIYKGN